MKKRPLLAAMDIRRRRAMPKLRRRLLFLIGGVLIGVAAVCMALLADKAQWVVAMTRERYPYLPAANFAPLIPQVPINVLAILFMAAYLAGVVQAPLTPAIIVSEMTADHALILPIMISALAASVISKAICPDGIYHALAGKFAQGKTVTERHP